MKESQLLGTLLPVIPDFVSIEQAIREKYSLPEISPDDDPITEIYLGDEIIPLDEFHKDIEIQVRENLTFLPPDLAKAYTTSKVANETQDIGRKELELLPDELKKGMEEAIKFSKLIANFVVQIVDPLIIAIVDMLYIHLLTGETQEVPKDWISKVTTIPAMGEPIVMVMAGQMSNPDVIMQQFRAEYKKTFGNYRPRITNTVMSTAYYLRLKKEGKRWDYIVEEYIRLNKFSLPRDRSSTRYYETWHKYEQRLKKRIQRTKAVLDVLFRDNKQ